MNALSRDGIGKIRRFFVLDPVIEPNYNSGMRYSRVFPKTVWSAPQGLKTESNRLLLRGGFIRPLGQGLFSLLPMGVRVLRNIEGIVRREMQALGGQEVLMPLVNPLEIWRRSGRDKIVSRDMASFKDRYGHEYVLAPTHEEASVELSRLGLNSYRDLPIFIYQFQSKFRDEEKIRYGLIRTREFLMKDGYSFHRTYADLNNFFPKMYRAYQHIFKACGLKVVAAEAGVGYMGGEKSYEFLMPCHCGDDSIIRCPSCAYVANREIAKGLKVYASESPEEMQRIKTPGCKTMDSLSAFLNLPKTALAKTMVYMTSEGLVMAVVRGEQEVSLEKLGRMMSSSVVRLADTEELKEAGLVPGYLSPLGVDEYMTIVADESVANSPNLVYGGNEPETHYINGNFGRDFSAGLVGDIARVNPGDRCSFCGELLQEETAVELGNIFKLGDYYSRSMELFFQEESGTRVYPYMGSYGIGVSRLLAAVVESRNDDKGILWPFAVAPYKMFLMSIGKSFGLKKIVEEIHAEFQEDTLYDDRVESISVKFKDCDLLGIPLRIVVSARNMADDMLEIKERNSDETFRIKRSQFKKWYSEYRRKFGLSL
jgi:prolyl-tRNA synthetase